TPFWGYGSSINVPIRLGIGLAPYDHGPFVDEVNIAARFPLEIGIRFHSVPLELYGEIALKITFVDPNTHDPHVDLDGGVRLRCYFQTTRRVRTRPAAPASTSMTSPGRSSSVDVANVATSSSTFLKRSLTSSAILRRSGESLRPTPAGVPVKMTSPRA